MKIKVNKNQLLDDYEKYSQRMAKLYSRDITSYYVVEKFVEEDVTEEQLLDYIHKGYGIKINCHYE
jgi:hypothetical protein